MTLQQAVINATHAGFKVWHDEHGWWITTPRRPYQKSEDHGTWKTEERAWFAAASMCED